MDRCGAAHRLDGDADTRTAWQRLDSGDVAHSRIQLSNVDGDSDFRSVGIASALKLLLAPVLAFAAVLAIGFQNQTVARVVVLLLATRPA